MSIENRGEGEFKQELSTEDELKKLEKESEITLQSELTKREELLEQADKLGGQIIRAQRLVKKYEAFADSTLEPPAQLLQAQGLLSQLKEKQANIIEQIETISDKPLVNKELERRSDEREKEIRIQRERFVESTLKGFYSRVDTLAEKITSTAERMVRNIKEQEDIKREISQLFKESAGAQKLGQLSDDILKRTTDERHKTLRDAIRGNFEADTLKILEDERKKMGLFSNKELKRMLDEEIKILRENSLFDKVIEKKELLRNLGSFREIEESETPVLSEEFKKIILDSWKEKDELEKCGKEIELSSHLAHRLEKRLEAIADLVRREYDFDKGWYKDTDKEVGKYADWSKATRDNTFNTFLSRIGMRGVIEKNLGITHHRPSGE